MLRRVDCTECKSLRLICASVSVGLPSSGTMWLTYLVQQYLNMYSKHSWSSDKIIPFLSNLWNLFMVFYFSIRAWYSHSAVVHFVCGKINRKCSQQAFYWLLELPLAASWFRRGVATATGVFDLIWKNVTVQVFWYIFHRYQVCKDNNKSFCIPRDRYPRFNSLAPCLKQQSSYSQVIRRQTFIK